MKQKIKKLIPIFIATVIIVVAALSIITGIKKSSQLTDLELQAFTEKSTELMNFFEEIDNPNDRDETSNQVAYAIESLYAENPQEEYSLDTVQNKITASFVDAKNLEDELANNAAFDLSGNQTFYDEQTQTFHNTKSSISHKEIIITPITKYVMTSVKKHQQNYIASFEKYVFEEPYMIIDRTSQDDITGKHSVRDYLDGKGTSLALKELVNSTNAKDICEPEKTITVTFRQENGILKIEKYQ